MILISLIILRRDDRLDRLHVITVLQLFDTTLNCVPPIKRIRTGMQGAFPAIRCVVHEDRLQRGLWQFALLALLRDIIVGLFVRIVALATLPVVLLNEDWLAWACFHEVSTFFARVLKDLWRDECLFLWAMFATESRLGAKA